MLARLFQAGLLLALCLLPAVAQEGKRVSYDFIEVDLRFVVETLANQLDRPVVVSDRFRGTVSLRVENAPVERALEQVLRVCGGWSRQYGDTLYISTGVCSGCRDLRIAPGEQPIEVLLDRAYHRRVRELLGQRYPELRFLPHETHNGFYVSGPLESLKGMGQDLPYLDCVPPPSPFTDRVWDPNMEEMAQYLWTFVPGSRCALDGSRNLLTVEGDAEEVARVKAEFAHIARLSALNTLPRRFHIAYRIFGPDGVREEPSEYSSDAEVENARQRWRNESSGPGHSWRLPGGWFTR
ncbi:MAG: hypothetical protein AB7S38_35335 [Vulcanimicrobiota bacterium]